MRWTRSISDRARWRFKWFPQLFLVPRNKQQCGGALIAKREEWIGAPSQVRTPEERACGIGLDWIGLLLENKLHSPLCRTANLARKTACRCRPPDGSAASNQFSSVPATLAWSARICDERDKGSAWVDSEKGKRSQRSLTSAGVALALICACCSGHARLRPGRPFWLC